MRKKLRIYGSVCLLLFIGIIYSFNTKAVVNDYYEIDIKTTTPSLSSGNEIRLSVDVSFSSLTSNYSNAVLEIEIPSLLTGVSIVAADLPVTYSSGESAKLPAVVLGNKIRYVVPSGKSIEPGYSTSIDLIKVTTARYVTLPGNVSITASITANTNNGVQSLSDAQNVTITTIKNFTVNKSAQYVTYNNDDYVRYRIFITSSNTNGALAAKGFTVTDVLPNNAVFHTFDDPTSPNINDVRPTLVAGTPSTWGTARVQPYSNIPASYPAGSLSVSGNTITWNVPSGTQTYNNNSYLETTFWVKLDGTLPDNSILSNKAEMSTTYIDDISTPTSSTSNISIVSGDGNPKNLPGKEIYFNNGGYGNDTSMVYYKILGSTLRNESNVVLNNYTITDSYLNYSNSMTLKNILVPTMRAGEGNPFIYDIFFYNGSTQLSSFTNKSTASNQTYTAPLGSNSYKIVFGTVHRTETSNFIFNDIIIGFAFDSTKLEENKCLFNRASFEYEINGVTSEVTKSSGCTPVSDEGATRLSLTKRVINNKGIYQYEDNVTYQISYSNSIYSGKSAKGVVFYDLLPKGVLYIEGSTIGSNIEIVSVDDNYRDGRQRIGWRLKVDLVAGASGNFTFDAFISEKVDSGKVNNDVYLLADTKFTNTFNYATYPKDTTDIDGDNDKNEAALIHSVEIDTVAYKGILVIKEVKGDQDSDWSRYPASGNVSASGQFQYRISIVNLSDNDISNIKVIDVLPFIGDRGVIVATNRESAWTPYLKAAIPNTDGFNIKYATSNNPNRGLVGRPAIGEASTSWLSSAPSDITSVRSLLIEHDGILASDASKVFTFNMISPVGAPSNGEIAWNSLAIQAKTSSNTLTTPTEPKKVGIKTIPATLNSISGQTWLDTDKDGLYDSNEAGLNGILVYLLDENGYRIQKDGEDVYTISAPNQLGANGHYTFVNIAQGNYRVEFVQLTNYGLTNSPDLSNPLNTDSSDYDLSTKKTNTFNVSSNVVGLDGGFTLSNIGNYIFEDFDHDGLQDSNEVGIPGVSVELYLGSTLLKTSITDSDGLYVFNDLITNDYSIKINKNLNVNDVGNPNMFLFYGLSPSNSGNDALDSDFDVTSNVDVPQVNISTKLAANGIAEDDYSIDGGLYKGNSSLSGLVWEDLKQDNIQGLKPSTDPEEGVSNVVIELYNHNNILLLSTLTDNLGQYKFLGLAPGDYYVKVTNPSDYTLVLEKVGSDSSIDSDFMMATNTTSKITLLYDENKTNIDAGIHTSGQGKISGFAYVDDNYNCTYNIIEGENTYPNLSVSLVLDGLSIATTTTNNDGYYEFINLNAGNYKVVFTEAAANLVIGYSGVTDNGADTSLEIVAELDNQLSVLSNIPTGGVCLQYEKSSIGDYIWLDEDRDGLQGVNEHGFKDALVKLLKNGSLTGDSVTTNETGYYLFTDLDANYTYSIEVTLPSSDYAFTMPYVPNTGNVLNSIITPTIDPLVGTNPGFVVGTNITNTTFDAGVVYKPSRIGDKIWFDEDQDGVQDPLEQGIAGIELELRLLDGSVVATATTDGNGNYLFNNLNPNTYQVHMVNHPDFLVATTANNTSDDLDSDFNRNSLMVEVELAADENIDDIDGGLIARPVKIGDYIWIDMNQDGLQDSSDLPASTTVYLYKEINNVKTIVETGQSNASGQYSFDLLNPYQFNNNVFTPYNYYVGYDLLLNTVVSPNYMVLGSTIDNDNNFKLVGNVALSDVVKVSNTYVSEIMNIDGAMEYLLSEIKGSVWHDLNRNGIMESNEPNYPGVTLKLYKKDGATNTLVATQESDSNGNYLFTDLIAGEYFVEITLLDDTKEALVIDHATSIDVDSDFCPVQDTSGDYEGISSVSCLNPKQTNIISLGYNEKYQDVDAGIQSKYGSIGDYAWVDLNGNGLQDTTEPALANQMIKLLDVNLQMIREIETDSNGKYLFDKLEAGTYYIETNPQAKYALTIQSSANEELNSNINPLLRQTSPILIGIGEKLSNIDVGFIYEPASIGDYLWFDQNENGLQDNNEAGIASISVSLKNSDGSAVIDRNGLVVADTITSVLGFYEFTNLNPGTYQVIFNLSNSDQIKYNVTQSVLFNDGIDSNINEDFIIEDIVLGINETNVTYDAGLVLSKVSLGGKTWLDNNKNGLNDDNTTLSNIQVKLYIKDTNNQMVLLATQTTDGLGYYLFENLEAQRTYQVLVAKQNMYDFTILNSGSDITIDSDVNQNDGLTTEIYIDFGENIRNIDAGYTKGSSKIGDYIWVDTDKDGIQDTNEKGLSGIKVSLYNKNNILVASTITNQDGYYIFEELSANEYYIKIDLNNPNLNFTISLNTNLSTNSDFNNSGLSPIINLGIDETNLDIDAGIIISIPVVIQSGLSIQLIILSMTLFSLVSILYLKTYRKEIY